MVPVHLFSPQEEEVQYFSWGHRWTHSAAPFIKNIWTFVWNYITLPRLFLNWKKQKQGIQLCYDVYNETKQHFEIPIYFCFLSNLFLIKFWKFLVLYLRRGCTTFGFTTQMTSNHHLPNADEWKTWVQRPPNIFQNVEKDM